MKKHASPQKIFKILYVPYTSLFTKVGLRNKYENDLSVRKEAI